MKEKRSIFPGLSSWALSLVTALFALIILIFLANILVDVVKLGDIGEIIAYISYVIIIVTSCFFICRDNPKSVWYAPILCNIMGIISAIIEPNFWISALWIYICFGLVLSIIGAIIGAKAGRRIILSKQG